MGVTIDQSLLKFNDEVSPELSNMTSEVSSLTSKLSNIVSINSSTKAVVEKSYKSINQAEIYGKFDAINAQYNNIMNFINSGLNGILNSTSTLLSMISTLIKYKEDVDLAEKNLNIAKSKPKRSCSDNASSSEKAEVYSYNAAIDTEIAECQKIYDDAVKKFNDYQEETLAFFNKLKGTDPALNTTATIASVPSSLPDGLTGTFTKAKFNGMGYYIYVPEGANLTSGLPVTVFLHGAGENSINKVTKNSLPYLLSNGMQTDGIVICPVSTSGKWNASERENVMALTNEVVKNYSADTNRVSLAGYSNGAIASYTLAAKYSDYFSCVVPIAGEYWLSSDAINNLAKTKVWAFHGNKDVTFKIGEVSKKWDKVAAAGGQIDASVYDAGHGGKEKIMTMVFSQGVRSDKFTGGQNVSLLEWMQEQDRRD